MKSAQLALGALLLAAAIGILAGCGSSGGSNNVTQGEASTPSAPAATPPPPTVTPVPDNLTAEQLRLLIVAAASTVKQAEYDVHSSGTTTTHIATKSLDLTSTDASQYSPPLNPTDRVDSIQTADGKTYFRVDGGPWRHNADADGTPPSSWPQDPFPYWLRVVKYPLGHQEPASVEQKASAFTVTDLSIAAAASEGSNRCWTLTVTMSGKASFSGSAEQEWTMQQILTACEPDFLVAAYTLHHVSGPGAPGSDNVFDNWRYNTGETLEIPTQVIELHCPLSVPIQQLLTCMFK